MPVQSIPYACKDIDGALVGGASLKAESFSKIVKFRKEP
jgi:triosephosphate isomerase